MIAVIYVTAGHKKSPIEFMWRIDYRSYYSFDGAKVGNVFEVCKKNPENFLFGVIKYKC